MYLEHFQLTHSPFAEEPDPEVFFPGARREEICQSLILDVLAGKQLIKLVGREGSGKTLICRLIVERLPSEYQVVLLDNPVGSFEDLLRIACIDLGMDPRGKNDPALFLEEFQKVLDWKRSERIKVVLIIDEAEKLFPATLERLMRHICDNGEEYGLTVILAGRPGLDAHLDQLSVYCTMVDIYSGYILEELTESETRQYIRFRLNAAGMHREQHEDIFSEGAVGKIFDDARGSLRMINILAEETLQAFCTEKSFMVLLDHVEPEEPEPDKPIRLESRVIELYELLRYNRVLVGALAGVVIVVLLTGFLLMGDSGKESPLSVPTAERSDIVSPRQDTASSVTGSAGTQPAQVVETKKPEGGQLFRERLVASASWLAGIHKGDYTIAVMMVAADNAQESVGDMLAQDDYYSILDQLYVLRKNTTPPTIFVFHGMYDSMEAARVARNDMPVFLRKHHPYPLAVGEALKQLKN
jgi:MSHA biogenesis protein MshM